MQVVNWARIVHIKLGMDQLKHVGVLIWLNVRDQAAHGVRLCQRVSILIDFAWRQQVRMDNIFLIPNSFLITFFNIIVIQNFVAVLKIRTRFI